MMLIAQAPERVIGNGGLIFIGLYCVALLVIGWLGHRAKNEDSMSDFYLGGRGLGFFVLLLTLYATQYSGNTLMGFVGQTYRSGFVFVGSATAMMAIVGAYLIYAPQLYELSKSRGYITMGDFVQDRFGSRRLRLLVVTLGVVALCNFILTNLLALGKLTEFVSGGAIGFGTGVVILAIVMVIYENLGGMRSVAWTDVVQGLILMVGVVAIFIAIQVHSGGLGAIAEQLEANKPGIYEAPSLKAKFDWLSKLLLFFFGISMYPHAIQRIYAAKSKSVLKRSLQVMVFMPLVTTLLMVILGITGIAKFPGLPAASQDQVTLLLLEDLVKAVPGMEVLVVVFIAAIFAATMSTIDSSLLAISSMLTRDVYQPIRPEASQDQLTRMGKTVSIVLMAVIVVVAIRIQEQSIWSILELKLELLCQVAPAFMLGVHWKSLRATPVYLGMATGTIFAIALHFVEPTWVAASGVKPGLYGLALNVIVIIVVQRLTSGTPKLRS